MDAPYKGRRSTHLDNLTNVARNRAVHLPPVREDGTGGSAAHLTFPVPSLNNWLAAAPGGGFGLVSLVVWRLTKCELVSQHGAVPSGRNRGLTKGLDRLVRAWHDGCQSVPTHTAERD